MVAIYCNLRLAVAHVMNACGAADIIVKMYGDDDDDAIITQLVYMDEPYLDIQLRIHLQLSHQAIYFHTRGTNFTHELSGD